MASAAERIRDQQWPLWLTEIHTVFQHFFRKLVFHSARLLLFHSGSKDLVQMSGHNKGKIPLGVVAEQFGRLGSFDDTGPVNLR